MANTFDYFTGLTGFHVYSNTVIWKPRIGQKISFKREHDKNYDKFAVAGKTLLKGKIGPVTVYSNQLLFTVTGIFQENFLETPSMPYKKGQNFKLPFMMRKLSHRL